MVLTKGAPFGATNVLGYLIYNESFWNSRFGYGACLERRCPLFVDHPRPPCSKGAEGSFRCLTYNPTPVNTDAETKYLFSAFISKAIATVLALL